MEDYEKIEGWFLRESLRFSFEIRDVTYDEFLEEIKDIVSKELKKNEKKEKFNITYLQNGVYENFNKGTEILAVQYQDGTSKGEKL